MPRPLAGKEPLERTLGLAVELGIIVGDIADQSRKALKLHWRVQLQPQLQHRLTPRCFRLGPSIPQACVGSYLKLRHLDLLLHHGHDPSVPQHKMHCNGDAEGVQDYLMNHESGFHTVSISHTQSKDHHPTIGGEPNVRIEDDMTVCVCVCDMLNTLSIKFGLRAE
eukprot:2475163-Rhodomonas_salina.1